MATEPKKRRGRPTGYRVENPASQRLPVRFTQDQLDDYRLAADKSGVSLSEWARSMLDKAARKILDK